MTKLRTTLLIVLLAVPGNSAEGQSLRGSRASVDRMFTRAVRNDLDFLRTSKSVYGAARDGELVMLSITNDLTLDDVGYPFVLPRTLDVVNIFARKYHDACGERITVTSASRPRSEQPRNASPKSVHPTGMAVDFRRPSGDCLTWMRKELVRLERQGILEATEERYPVHFHVAVLQRGTFAPAAPAVATSTAGLERVVSVVSSIEPTTATADGVVEPASSEILAERLTSNPASAPLPVQKPPARSTTYVVQKGDNLSTIAERHGITTARLQSLNGLKRSIIRPGQKLRIR